MYNVFIDQFHTNTRWLRKKLLLKTNEPLVCVERPCVDIQDKSEYIIKEVTMKNL